MATKSQGKLLKPNSHQKAKLPLNPSQLASKSLVRRRKIKALKPNEKKKQNTTLRQDKPKATRKAQNMLHKALPIQIKINEALEHDPTYMISMG
jgi:hypothetical protein